MGEITNITIQNIKGFLDHDNSFDVHIRSNKVNLLVAPNGFGKSSIAKAFESLNANRLDLPDDLYNDKKSDLLPEIRVKFDGQLLTANKDHNSISDVFDVTVINSGLKASSKVKRIHNQIVQKGILEVEQIILRTSIPLKSKLNYRLTRIKESFGTNKKVLTDLSNKFEQDGIGIKITNLYPLLENLHRGVSKKFTRQICDYINAQKGSAERILENLRDEIFQNLESLDTYVEFQNKTREFRDSDTCFERFQMFYQFIWLYENNRQNILEVRRYEEYVRLRDAYNNIISSIDTTGRNLQAQEIDGKLIISFPPADTISNGQRDIITFIVSLVKFQMNYNSNKKQILIIDEVFDYLDDANVITAQYFLSKFLDLNHENFYLIILSHITEEHFRGWVLKRKLNTQYIKPVQAKARRCTKVFIAHRDSLKSDAPEQYAALSNFYFHYNPNTKDQDLSIAYRRKDDLKQTWFKGTNLHEDIIQELNKYLHGQTEYDPYAVCFSLRFACEKMIYNQLHSSEERYIFLEENKKTKDKLSWAELHGYDVPVIYYILSIIFNEAEHITGPEVEQNRERSCVYRLEHGAIRQMARELFGYKGTDLTVDAIL